MKFFSYQGIFILLFLVIIPHSVRPLPTETAPADPKIEEVEIVLLNGTGNGEIIDINGTGDDSSRELEIYSVETDLSHEDEDAEGDEDDSSSDDSDNTSEETDASSSNNSDQTGNSSTTELEITPEVQESQVSPVVAAIPGGESGGKKEDLQASATGYGGGGSGYGGHDQHAKNYGGSHHSSHHSNHGNKGHQGKKVRKVLPKYLPNWMLMVVLET